MAGHDLDECLELVSNRNRRGVIDYLRNGSDGEATVEEITDYLHSIEPESASVPGSGRYQMEIQLHHDHLTKMESHAIIEYNPQDQLVRYQPDRFIEELLDSLPEETIEVEC